MNPSQECSWGARCCDQTRSGTETSRSPAAPMVLSDRVSHVRNDSDIDTFSATFDTIERFNSVSGLKLNNAKTEALWIGLMPGKKEKLFPEKNF